jgi:predicted Zn-dependent protease
VLRAGRAFGAGDAEAIISAGSSALTRFANNAIHQNVAERSWQLSVRVQMDGRTARATTNRLDDAAIRQVVEEAVALTKLQEPDPALLPLWEDRPAGVSYLRWHEATARVTPTERAQAVAEAIRIVEGAGQTAAGIYSTAEAVFALLNSRGVFAYYPETMANFSITAMAADSSGWAKGSACSHRDLDPAAMARAATGKAQASRDPVELPPGAYTVILEPAVRRLQRHRHQRRPQLPTRPHRREAVRRQHHYPRRCVSSAAGRRTIRWRRRPAAKAGAGGPRRGARGGVLPPSRASRGRGGHRARLPAAERVR